MVKFGDNLYIKLVTNYTNFTAKHYNFYCDVPVSKGNLISSDVVVITFLYAYLGSKL